MNKNNRVAQQKKQQNLSAMEAGQDRAKKSKRKIYEEEKASHRS